MNSTARIGIVVALLVVVGVTMALKQKNKDTPRTGDQPQARAHSESRPAEAKSSSGPAATRPLPRLVDLGADKCIPCKQMAPILENLRKDFAGKLEVEFIDVWKDPNAGDLYGIRMIPTQIFFDASEKELFRHEGFFSREDILAKWKEFGVDLTGKTGESK